MEKKTGLKGVLDFFSVDFNPIGTNDILDIHKYVMKTSFKMLELTFSSKLDWGSYIVSIAKTASKKIGALIRSMKFLSPEVALYLYNLPYSHVWNTAVMFGLVLLVATWNCWISYRNGYVGLLVLHLLPLLNPWHIVEM